MQLDQQKMTEAMTEAMACMYNTQKSPNGKLSGTKPTGYKSYLGKTRGNQPQPYMPLL